MRMSLNNTDHEVLTAALDWIHQGYRPVLVTVAKTWGSSPRPTGSLMVMREDGVHVGSVSGGCIEDDLLARYRNHELARHFPTVVSYGTHHQETVRFGLPCGGRLELVIEQLAQPAALEELLQRITAGELVLRHVDLNSGMVSQYAAHDSDEFEYRHGHLKKVFGQDWQLLLIGAGDLSHYVAQIALMLGYRVTVCDPRDDYRRAWRLQDVELLHCMPDDAVKTFTAPAMRRLVVTLTHDPKLDDMALMEALSCDVFYVGALGSKKSNDRRRQRLLELELSAQQLARLHAPVGLPIGSHTPPEIAVSIMAGITAARHGAAEGLHINASAA